MPRRPGPLFEVYVFDSSSLIELERGKQLRKLREPEGRIIVPDRVEGEVAKARAPLKTWLARHRHVVSRFAVPKEAEVWQALLRQTDPKVHDGEAAALAMAIVREKALVSEERAVQRKAEEKDVRCLKATDFLREW